MMKCPACGETLRERLALGDGGPLAIWCAGCGGAWLRAVAYWRWIARRGPLGSGVGDLPATPVAEDREGLRHCPDDGHFMARFRVSRSSDLYLDQCRTCAGVWLDQGEWTSLGELGLQSRLGEVLSEDWERELREAERAAREEAQWKRQLGADDLQRITEIRDWLLAHPRRSELLAFLGIHQRPQGDVDG